MTQSFFFNPLSACDTSDLTYLRVVTIKTSRKTCVLASLSWVASNLGIRRCVQRPSLGQISSASSGRRLPHWEANWGKRSRELVESNYSCRLTLLWSAIQIFIKYFVHSTDEGRKVIYKLIVDFLLLQFYCVTYNFKKTITFPSIQNLVWRGSSFRTSSSITCCIMPFNSGHVSLAGDKSVISRLGNLRKAKVKGKMCDTIDRTKICDIFVLNITKRVIN